MEITWAEPAQFPRQFHSVDDLIYESLKHFQNYMTSVGDLLPNQQTGNTRFFGNAIGCIDNRIALEINRQRQLDTLIERLSMGCRDDAATMILTRKGAHVVPVSDDDLWHGRLPKSQGYELYSLELDWIPLRIDIFRRDESVEAYFQVQRMDETHTLTVVESTRSNNVYRMYQRALVMHQVEARGPLFTIATKMTDAGVRQQQYFVNEGETPVAGSHFLSLYTQEFFAPFAAVVEIVTQGF